MEQERYHGRIDRGIRLGIPGGGLVCNFKNMFFSFFSTWRILFSFRSLQIWKMVSLKKHHCDQKNCKLNQTHRWIPKRFGVWKNDWSLELSLQKMSKRNMSWFLIKMASDKVTCLNVWMWLVWRIFGLDPFWLAQCQFDPERSIVDCQVIESESSLLSINCRTIAMTLAATKMTWVHKNPSYFSFPISHCFSFKTGCFGSCWVGFIPTPRHQKSRDTKVCLNIAFFSVPSSARSSNKPPWMSLCWRTRIMAIATVQFSYVATWREKPPVGWGKPEAFQVWQKETYTHKKEMMLPDLKGRKILRIPKSFHSK